MPVASGDRVEPTTRHTPPVRVESSTHVESASPAVSSDEDTTPRRAIDALYDRDNPALSLLQRADDALAGFPVDRLGNIDWVQALRRGEIAPRASVSGRGGMQSLATDILMKNTRDMPWVNFPHAAHTAWLDCSNCHESPFRSLAGSNTITMDRIFRGEDCGLCHDRVAFSTFACERCHSVPHAQSPDAWWSH